MSEDIEHFAASHFDLDNPHAKGGFHCLAAARSDPAETAEYVRDMLQELEAMAARAGLATLAAMINFAAEEADQHARLPPS